MVRSPRYYSMLTRPHASTLRRLLATAARPTVQDIVVVGGGPAGLSLVAALKHNPKTRHLKCTLVEALSLAPARAFAASPPAELTNRIVSLTPTSVEFMQRKLGSWAHLHHDRVQFYNQMVAYDGQDAAARLHFDTLAHPESSIAAMCEIANIQALLLALIEALRPHLAPGDMPTILDQTKVLQILSAAQQELHSMREDALAGPGEPPAPTGSDWPVVTLSDGTCLQARLLVGADGQNSPVRRYADIESRGWAYGRFGVVGVLRLQYEDHRDIAWQRFLTTGPVALLPMPGDAATFVWSCTPEMAAVLQAVDPEVFPHLLNAAFTLDEVDLQYLFRVLEKDPGDRLVIGEIEWRTGRIPEQALDDNYPVPVAELVANSRAKFPLKFLHADTYIGPRVALVGDAAHTVHPLAGQGLNMGQSDVAALVEALERGVDRGLDLGLSLVLEPYVAKAWPANHVLMGACDKLHKVFSTDFAPLVLARGAGMKALNFFDAVKLAMVANVSGR